MSLSKVRMVPTIWADSGIILNLIPEWIEPIDITAPSFVSSEFLLIILCKPSIILAEIKIGSTLFHGCDP